MPQILPKTFVLFKAGLAPRDLQLTVSKVSLLVIKANFFPIIQHIHCDKRNKRNKTHSCFGEQVYKGSEKRLCRALNRPLFASISLTLAFLSICQPSLERPTSPHPFIEYRIWVDKPLFASISRPHPRSVRSLWNPQRRLHHHHPVHPSLKHERDLTSA